MVAQDAYFDGLDEAWAWVAPHPADPVGIKRGRLQTRVGTGSLSGLTALLELRSKPARLGGGWVSSVYDLARRRAREVGSLDFDDQYSFPPMTGSRCRLGEDPDRAEWDADGRFAVQGVEDWCTMATRGKPVPGPPVTSTGLAGVKELGTDIVGFGARLLGRRQRFEQTDAGRDAEARRTAAAERDERYYEATRVDDHVATEVSAFDGWLRARQHRTPGDELVEVWQIDIDRSRPAPASISLALLNACASLCHRRIARDRPAGVLDT